MCVWTGPRVVYVYVCVVCVVFVVVEATLGILVSSIRSSEYQGSGEMSGSELCI